MNHWASTYIGGPWVVGESDCWAFARRVWHERFGLEVPTVAVDASSPRAVRRAFVAGAEGWNAALTPCEGDAVLMAKGVHPCHVGVWIAPPEGAGVLHAVEGAGVIFTPVPRLHDLGYRITGFYRRAG